MDNFLLGGVECLLLNLVRGLDKEKFDPIVITLTGGGIMENDFRGAGAKIFFAGPRDRYSSFLGKVFWVLLFPLLVIRLAFLFRKVKPDLVVSSMYKADIASFAVGAKPLSIQHDMVKINPVAAAIKRMALKRAVKITAISESVKDFLKDYFKADDSKIEVVINGIEFDRFSRLRKPENEWKPLFGTVARMSKIKGHIHLLRAMKKMKDTGFFSELILVGDGTERPYLEAYTKENELNVSFVGERIDMDEYLKKIDVFVLPSLSEGLGMSIIEAMAAGKLVITSNAGGIKELINDKKSGILVNPGDEEGLYQAMRWVIENKEEAMSVRRESVNQIDKKREIFDIKKVCERYSEIFEGLMKK